MTSPIASTDDEEDHSRRAAGEVTELLRAWQDGDLAAGEELSRRIYPELRRLAARRLREESAALTLQPTELVSELVLRLVGSPMPRWESRVHFLAIASRLVRQILVDRARRRRRHKRGDGAANVSLTLLDPGAATTGLPVVELVAVEEVLARLSRADPIASELVAMRFYGGLSIEDAAEVLGIGRTTAVRRFRAARAFLRQQLGVSPAAGSGP